MQKKRIRVALITAFFLLTIALPMHLALAEEFEPSPSPSPAPTAAPVVSQNFTLEATLGYDGLVVMSRWVPAFVTVTNNGSDFEGILGVNVFFSLTQYDRYELPLTIATGATKRVVLPIRPQTQQDMYAFELVEDDKIIAETRVKPARVVAPEAVTIGVLSQETQVFTYMNQRANNADTLRGETWLAAALTEENFPDSSNLMSAFQIIVIDGFDLKTLSQPQQDAFSAWLAKGGIAIVSGGAKAAMGYPFFSQWTGLEAGALSEAEGVAEALTAYMTIAQKPLEGSVWLSDMPTKDALITKDGKGLLSLNEVGSGFIFTTSFDLGGKPLSGWASMTSFWPRVFRQSIPDAYNQMLTSAEDSRYGNDMYRTQNLINSLLIPNSESGLPVILLLVLFLFVAGIGGYLLLKKLDRREWLWIAAPVSAVVFALILLLLSGRSEMNKPVALTASRVLMNKDGAQVTTYIGVASPDKGELTIETDQEQLPTVLLEQSYYNEESDKLFRPLDMRQRYHFGAHPKVGFAQVGTWEPQMLMVDSVRTETGTLDARLWIEADGVHGEVVNNTPYMLSDIVVLTKFGYCIPEDLLPGQKAEIALLLTGEKPDSGGNGPQVFKPNVMYSVLDVDPVAYSTGLYSDNLYSFLRAALYGIGKDVDYNNAEATRKETMIQLFESALPMYGSKTANYLYAFNNTIGGVAVTLDGKLVERSAHSSVVGCAMTFEPIGPTGEVLYEQGMIPMEIVVDQGDDTKPRLPTEADGDEIGGNVILGKGSNDYVSLAAPTALRFVLPSFGTYNIERITVAGMSYDAIPDLFIYNNQTGAFDKMALTFTMKGDAFAPYVDEEGAAYLRYVPSETGSRYGGMSMPMVALKGKVK